VDGDVSVVHFTNAITVVVLLAAGAAAAPVPGSRMIDCSQADTLVTVDASSHLDPACTWTRGVRIVASDVVLDCQGARIVGPERRYGIEISAPTTVALSNITVRNCYVEGFLNNVHIIREGFRDLTEGEEYDNAFSNILIEDSTLMGSRGVGIFVDGYVTGVTLRNLHIEGSGSSGVYLEAGSKDNVVDNNDIINNGYSENGPQWQEFELSGLTFWFWGTGREGLSIDGSRFNRIVDNRFSGNSYGSIFLYKNCGEFVNERPQRWWHRRYGADGNIIEGNSFTDEPNGVWIASRMGENILPMDCSDPQYRLGYSLDYGADNVVRDNLFDNVTYGVRVEDDGNTITGNRFSGDGAQQAVVVGTRYRTVTLGLPVRGTTVTGNTAMIPANPEPYRWIYQQQSTTFGGNVSVGDPVVICEGVPLRTGPFVMTVAVTTGDNPPTEPPPAIPPPAPLPPCPCAGDCSGDGSVTVEEIVRGVSIALGGQALSTCGAYDGDASNAVTVDEVVRAVDAALNGCG
jgi:parallel beta-helix repeat protein